MLQKRECYDWLNKPAKVCEKKSFNAMLDGKIAVKLIPRKNSDGNRIKKKNVNPLQCQTVEGSFHLSDIQRFVTTLAFQKEDPNIQVELYLSSNGIESKLPLTLTVAEYAYMTHQTNSVEIKYSYNKIQTVEQPKPPHPLPPPQPKPSQEDIIAQLQPKFLPPLPSAHPVPMVSPSKNLDSVLKTVDNPPSFRFGEGASGMLFSTGLTLWNDSFGPVPMEKKSSGLQTTPEKSSTPESVNLKSQLESLMQQGKH